MAELIRITAQERQDLAALSACADELSKRKAAGVVGDDEIILRFNRLQVKALDRMLHAIEQGRDLDLVECAVRRKVREAADE